MSASRILAVLFCLLSVACAPVIKTAGPAVTEAKVTPDYIVTSDSQHLPLRSWLPPGPPQAVIIAVHGFNDYSHAFEGTGRFFAERGIAVYAFDQRGFGNGPDRGFWPGQDTLADDLSEATRLISARHPGVPVYLLGESMGGAVVMVTMTRPGAPKVQGIILAAPAVWDRGAMNIFQRGALWTATHTMPWLTLTGRGLHIQASDNIEMLRELGRDPLVIKETRVDAIHGLCDLMDNAAAVAPKLHVPALVLYGERDEVVPATPTYEMMSHLPNNPVPQVKAIYANGYHMLLRDLQADVVLGDIDAWIKRPKGPLPSGADDRAHQVLSQQTSSAG